MKGCFVWELLISNTYHISSNRHCPRIVAAQKRAAKKMIEEIQYLHSKGLLISLIATHTVFLRIVATQKRVVKKMIEEIQYLHSNTYLMLTTVQHAYMPTTCTCICTHTRSKICFLPLSVPVSVKLLIEHNACTNH